MEFNRQRGGVLEPLPAPLDRHRHGPRAHHRGDPGQDRRTTTPTCSSRSSPPSASSPAGATATTTTPTSRCASSPITCAPPTFLIADGVVPSNEWRGYVLRKIMRRAMRHGKRLGLRDPFLHRLVDVVVAEMGDAYPELRAQPRRRRQRGQGRGRALRRGAHRRTAPARGAARSRGRVARRARVPGDEVFRLYDSLGVPVDFIEDLASERQLTLDREGYERAMEGQRERARAGSTLRSEEGRGVHVRLGRRARQRIEQTPRSLRRLRHHRVDDAHGRRAVRRDAARRSRR